MKFPPLHLHLASLLTANNDNAKQSTQRRFQFVEYGASIPAPSDEAVTTISCDGRIDGVSLELTHWNGNDTPDKYYADTSTGMALNFCQDNLDEQSLIVANNHFDTDGVLSVFACLNPEWFLQKDGDKYRQLLLDGAAAGDFGEWSSDAGIKLDSILEGICQEQSDEAQAYDICLKELPTIMENLLHEEGTAYEKYFQSTLDHARSSYEAIRSGEATFQTISSSSSSSPDSANHVIVSHEPFALSPYALHRGLVEQNLWPQAQRILRVIEEDSSEGSSSLTFWFEKPGHGWVSKLRDRPVIRPSPSDMEALLEALNQVSKEICELSDTSPWTGKGGRSLVSICQTSQPFAIESPEKKEHIVQELVNVLMEKDAPIAPN